VHHLGEWYAQAHPTEDFAETFAVWLKPHSDWRRSYADWPAYEKLQLVDELMASVRATRAPVRNRERVEPIDTNMRTLSQHYRRKLARHRHYRRGLADDMLQRLFSEERAHANSMRASTLLRAQKSALLGAVADELATPLYSVHQVLRLLIERSDALALYVRGNRREAARDARTMLARMTRLYAAGETPHLPL
jgi:signal transduction histidine kinase